MMKTISTLKLTLLSLLLILGFAACSEDEEEQRRDDPYDLRLPDIQCMYYANSGYFEAKVIETDADWTHVVITETPKGESLWKWKPKKMKFETFQMKQNMTKGMTIRFVLMARYDNKDIEEEEDLGIVRPYTGVNQDKSKWAAYPYTGLFTGDFIYHPGQTSIFISLETYEGRRLKGEYYITVSPVPDELAALPDSVKARFHILESKLDLTLYDMSFYEDAKIKIED